MPSFVRSGAPIRANSQTASSQNKSSITALADGGFVVTWQTMDNSADGSWWAIKSQRYNAQGVAAGAETLVNNLGAGDQIAAQTASLANGGYVVTWETSDTSQDGSGTAIKARLFNSAGTAVGGEFRVNSQTAQDQKDPTIAGLADGGFVVAWYTTDTSQDGAGWAIKAQRYDSAGAAVGAEFRVNTTGSGSQWKTDIAGLTNGGFIVTWQTGNDANSQVYGQLYGADGVKVGGQFVANGSITYDTLGKVAALPGGGFVVTWMTYDSDSLGIRAQIFNSSGAKVGSDFAVNSTTEGVQMDPDVATLADGTFLITWDSKAFGIKGQAFTATGQRIGGEFLVANGGSATGTGVAVAGLAGGNFVVSFTNNAGTSSGDDIELQMLQYNSTPNAAPQLGADTLSLSKQENQTSVTQLFATDSDGPYAVTFSIVGGTDAARFTVNAVTGTLSFVSAPNYEAPTDSDQNNVYQVIVRASDGEHHDQQTISVTVTNTNEVLAITSNGAGASAAISVAENKLDVTKVTAVDPEGAPITYSISGGADATRFLINSSTGVLSFLANPDYEQPGDADGNNVYLVTVRASDGTWTDTQALTITVTNANDRPVIVSNGGGASASIGLDEGQTAVTTVAATDGDGPNPVTYSITGGLDAALFAIDSATGALSFVAAPDYEAPAQGSNNVYSVTVTASDGALDDSQTLQVTVNDVNEGVTITSGATQSVAENSTAVTTVTAQDLDGDAVGFVISGGADSALFAVDSETGELSFLAAPNFEAPADFDGDNVYQVEVSASDGALSASQAISVTVGNVDEGLELLSYGGSETALLSLAENGSLAGQVEARDLDGGSVAYAIAGGADAGLFAVDAATGALTFLVELDFEAPSDSGGDNVYDVVVEASAGGSTATQSFAISVTNLNEGIAIVSNGGGTGTLVALNEGERNVTTVVAHDPDGTPVTYSIIGGADASRFTIDAATGLLALIDAPDFEAPADVGADNLYSVIVAASDGEMSASQDVQVTINDVDEGVTITTGPNLSVNEDSGFVTRVTATDGDGDPVSYSIVGGADASHFVIDSVTGDLTIATSLDFEAPADADGDNVYEVTVRASDGQLFDERQMSILVNDVYDDVEIVSYGGADSVSLTMQEGGSFSVADVDANMSPFMGVTFAISGGADADLFRVDPYSGLLAFAYGVYPDFEAPADSDGDNVYDVVVVANQLTTSDTQAFAITIANRNEGLWITSDGGGDAILMMNEGDSNVTTVTAFDQDGDLPTYSIVGGVDAALFAIDPATGVLTFIAVPDYEAPHNAAGTNSYLVEVGASDGEFTGTQRIRVEIGNVNERPAITSGGGGETVAVTANENGLAVTSIAASDPDGNPLTYSIAGGADASLFTIESWSGILRFVQAPNFEAPGDVGADNVYDVLVSVTDGVLTDSQAVAVTVANLAEIVTITSNGGGASGSVAVSENGTAVATVAAGNPDGGGAVTYAISGGADSARFTINAATGVLAFVSAPNFEAPTDAGANNVYDVVVSAANGATVDTQALAVTVGNVNEQMAIASNGGGAGAAVSVNENVTAVTTVVGVDPDGGPVTYVILSGGDSGLFTINATTGVLAFLAAPNFEAPGDVGGNNVYDVTVMGSDGHWSDTQAIAVTVGNVAEAPVITSTGGGSSGSVSVAENSVAVTVVAATDPDGGTATYSIVGGADSARFTINAQTGVLQLVAAPDWELPADSNGDNVYAVVVRASDGQLVDDQALNVTVTNTRDGNNVTGTTGSDSISATSTNIALRTSNEEDLVFGRDGHDSIQGMAGDDELYGEGGNDTLTGGNGADKLLGGLGKDQFTYNALSESTVTLRDLIMDFSRSQGDKISLSAIDSNSALSGNQAFTFIGTSAFSNVAGQLRYETSGGVTTISGDVNGDGVADLQIQLSGSIALIASDFIL